jgi:hypothetical protein
MKGQRGKKGFKKSKKAPAGAIVGMTTTRCFFPDRMRGKLFYDGNFPFTCAANTLASTVFRANSVHDPDYSGAGTTAAGYATCSAVYLRFRVIACKAILTVENTGAASTTMLVTANNLNTIGTSMTVAMAQRHVYSAPIGPTTGMGVHKHVVAFPIHKVYGCTMRQLMAEDDFTGTTASPIVNNQIFLHVGFNQGGTATTTILNIRLEYDVEWSIPINVPY